MSQALQKIDETREALSEALAERNWGAIGELDLGCHRAEPCSRCAIRSTRSTATRA